MAFVQIMSYTTDRHDEIDAAQEQWIEDTEGVRRSRRRLVLRDRDHQGRFVEVIYFDSYEDAMHNSMLPATTTLSGTIASLVNGELEFHNLDVLAEDT